ncbi:hypothetical protein DV515_00010579 [Chloebia gouldiae]|uniref:Uncharacterized protein n=1 Tax=Chloebia gouldiae TaxID=44316 RepID=A0A3L8S9M6_CHLGU|nr:hypothetical protein DV515_00010579 [Chloebia gouldiae]
MCCVVVSSSRRDTPSEGRERAAAPPCELCGPSYRRGDRWQTTRDLGGEQDGFIQQAPRPPGEGEQSGLEGLTGNVLGKGAEKGRIDNLERRGPAPFPGRVCPYTSDLALPSIKPSGKHSSLSVIPYPAPADRTLCGVYGGTQEGSDPSLWSRVPCRAPRRFNQRAQREGGPNSPRRGHRGRRAGTEGKRREPGQPPPLPGPQTRQHRRQQQQPRRHRRGGRKRRGGEERADPHPGARRSLITHRSWRRQRPRAKRGARCASVRARAGRACRSGAAPVAAARGSRTCGRGGPAPNAHAPRWRRWRRTLGSLAHSRTRSSHVIASPFRHTPLMTFSLIAVRRPGTAVRDRAVPTGLFVIPRPLPPGLLTHCLATVARPGDGAWRQGQTRRGHRGGREGGGEEPRGTRTSGGEGLDTAECGGRAGIMKKGTGGAGKRSLLSLVAEGEKLDLLPALTRCARDADGRLFFPIVMEEGRPGPSKSAGDRRPQQQEKKDKQQDKQQACEGKGSSTWEENF